MTDDLSPEGGGATLSRSPVVKGACYLLLVAGLMSLVFSLPVVLDPASAQCHLARTWIVDVNKDKKDWNDAEIAGQKPDTMSGAKKVSCADSLAAADTIRTDEKKPEKTATLPSEGVLRTQNILGMAMGVGMGVSGLIVLRTLSRQARNMALGFAGAGLILQMLGIYSLFVFAFVIYAFVFSPASRMLWPRAARPEPPPSA